MAELTRIHKEMIVVLLAQFRSPAVVAAQMREEHGVEVPIQQIVKYDPSRPSFEAGDNWRAIFDATRRAYLNDVLSVPIAHQAYRLNVLQEALEAARRARNWRLLRELLEQAAKEIGGALTNSREVSINDQRRAKHMTSEDRRQYLGSLIADAMAATRDSATEDDETKH
jgi:hypothetical protein